MARLSVLAEDDERFRSSYCATCGWYMPIGHTCSRK